MKYIFCTLFCLFQLLAAQIRVLHAQKNQISGNGKNTQISPIAPKANPAKVNPAKVNPAKANPAKANPAKANPAKANASKAIAPKAAAAKAAENIASEPRIIQWASQVKYASSAWRSKGTFSAHQLLGVPNYKSFTTKYNPYAWAGGHDGPAEQKAENANHIDTLIVGFAQSMRQAKQIVIIESHNPGAIGTIWLEGANPGEKQIIYTQKPAAMGNTGRPLHVFFNPPSFLVHHVGFTVHTGAVPDWNLIDAIGISNTTDSISTSIRLAPQAYDYRIARMDSNVNTRFSEVCPVVDPSGKMLYFSRRGHPGNLTPSPDIWKAELDQNGAAKGPAVNAGRPLNDNFTNFPCSITPDGNAFLLANEYDKNQLYTRGGISISFRSDTGWTFPVALDIPEMIIERFDQTGHYCLSTDRQVLLMCYEEPGSLDQEDIYVCFRNKNGSWTAPRNIGNTINTTGRESTIFLAPDTRTLFFASNGHNGYGDHDIFQTTRLDNTWTRWTQPINIGPVINSTDWDAYYSIDASGKKAYFVSDRSGNNDIYYSTIDRSQIAPVVLVQGRVYNQNTHLPLHAIIRYEDLSNGGEVGMAETNPDNGEYTIVLPGGINYGFRAEAEGYIAVSQHMDIRRLEQFEVKNVDLAMAPFEIGQTILMNNIFFEYNKWDLQPESFPELDRILKYLAENPNMKIHIVGHTDDIGSAGFNYTLSEKRAEAILHYLVQHGASPQRLTMKGMGKDVPVAENTSDEGRQKNRRVEFTIIEK
jgi:outer membrane protein OmpA-like peptidoglycan-associated protein